MGTREVYDREFVLGFFDSIHPRVRAAAWNWLRQDRSAGYEDSVLWCRLLETPYDDVRVTLIDELQRRTSLPGVATSELSPVWCSVLLGVHRGGRQKLKSTQQIAAAVIDDPQLANELLPVLMVAVRSIRESESSAGLAAVVRIAEARPELVECVESLLPELKLSVTNA